MSRSVFFVLGNLRKKVIGSFARMSGNLFGSISSLEAEISGSSDLLDYDLNISNLDINLYGASTAFLSVNESISIKASGASVLNYKGDATIQESELSGSSSIIKKD